MGDRKTRILIDAYNFLWRGYWAFKNKYWERQGSLPTNAIYGFFILLQSILTKTDGQVYIVWDPGGETKRHKLSDEYISKKILKKRYKGQEFRNVDYKHVESMNKQIPVIKKIIKAMGIPQTIKPGVEADDIIAYLTQYFSNRGDLVLIVSRDKDFYRLLSDRNVRVYDGERLWDEKKVEKYEGYPASWVTALGALAGDYSDNIEGAYGIGKKYALSFLQKYNGSLSDLVHDDYFAGATNLRERRVYLEKRRIIASYEMKRLRPEWGIVKIPTPRKMDTVKLNKLWAEYELSEIPLLRFKERLERHHDS